MSLIDFPNIPPLPGVPDLRRSAYGVAAQTGIMGKLQGLDFFGLLDNFLAPKWLILDKDGRAVITPDSVVAFEYRGESRIAGYPMEQGAFSSYNKVQMPFDIRVRMTCGGNGVMTRAVFLATLEYMKASLDLSTIVTPDLSYPSLNLEHFDYRRDSRNGVTLITVDAMFSEVRETASTVFSDTAQPSGQNAKDMSTVKPADPTPEQSAKYSSADTIAKLKAEFPNAQITVNGGT